LESLESIFGTVASTGVNLADTALSEEVVELILLSRSTLSLSCFSKVAFVRGYCFSISERREAIYP
jgi:hypothetical protein